MTDIQQIIEERNSLSERLKDYDAVISAFRKICKHEWEDNGHDSHYHYQICKICGKEKRI